MCNTTKYFSGQISMISLELTCGGGRFVFLKLRTASLRENMGGKQGVNTPVGL